MSSFKKRVPSAQASLPAGCRLSAYNGQVLISTGVPSLDDILGGGLPVGTILLIQEDRQTSYGQLLLKYFLRQGIVAGDKCVVVSGDERPEAIVRSLMGIAGEESLSGSVQQGVDNRDDDEEEKANQRRNRAKGASGSSSALDDEDSEQDRLTIAWRYSGLKKFESGVGTRPPAISSRVNKGGASNNGSEPALTPSQIPFCEQFDLTTRISAKALETADTTLIDSGELLRNKLSDNDNTDDSDDDDEDEDNYTAQRAERQPDQYRNVLDKIRETLIEGGFSTTLVKDPSAAPAAATPGALAERHICRIGINSIASPSWRSKTPQDLYKFLHALRGLLRFSFGAAVITIPAHLYGTIDQRHATDGSTSSPFIHRLEQLCDASVRIESFAGALTNASSAASAYHGLFHVHKIPVLNSLIPSSTKLSVLLDGAAKGSGGASASSNGSGGSSKGVNNLGFKVRRKRFAIETFHLPPEGGVGQRRTSSEPSSTSSSLSDRKGASGSSSSSSSSSSSMAPKKLSSGTEGSGRSRSLGGSGNKGATGQVDVHSVPGASGVARKMMGLPPKGIQGAVASGCSTGGSDGQEHQHSHAHGSSSSSSQRPGVNLGANSSLLDF